MLTSTIYDVRIKYAVDGRGATGVRQLSDEVKTLGRETGRVTGLFQRLGGVVAAYFGGRAAGRALIGFNATVQDTKLQIAGMLALTKKTDLSDQVGRADRLYSNLQKRAAALPGTTQEYVKMAGMLTQPITDAGLGMKDLEDLTVNTVVGAKALGVEWEAAARDVDQALRGVFHSTDQFTGKILGSVGYKGEEGRAKFNAMDPAARAETLRNALMQKQLVQLAAAQGQTFNGMLSTLQDTVQQFFGKVGLPLFKAITREMKQWTGWLSENQDKVDAFATRLADGLVGAFHALKDGVGFVIDHADVLLAIGKVWAAVKLGGMAASALGKSGPGGGIAGIAGRVGGSADFFRKGRDRFNPETGGYEYTPAGRGRQAVGGIAGALGNIGTLGQTFGAAYGIATVLNEWTGASSMIADGMAHLTGRVDETTDKFFQIQRSMDALDAATQRAAKGKEGLAGTAPMTNLAGYQDNLRMQANVIGDYLRARDAGDVGGMMQKLAAAQQLGLSGGDLTGANITSLNARAAQAQGEQGAVGLLGTVAYSAAMTQLTDYQKRTLDTNRAQLEVMTYLTQQVAKHEAFSPDKILEIMRNATEDPTGKYKPNMSGKPNVNITIQRIEVQSDDPDRYAFGLVEAFRDAVKNPSAAVRAIREG